MKNGAKAKNGRNSNCPRPEMGKKWPKMAKRWVIFPFVRHFWALLFPSLAMGTFLFFQPSSSPPDSQRLNHPQDSESMRMRFICRIHKPTPPPLSLSLSISYELIFGKGMMTATFQFSESGGSRNGARTSSLNCLSCRIPCQTPHSLNCLHLFH